MSNEAYVDSSGLVAPNEVSGAMRASLIENNGIDVIAESERTAKPSDLFWPWFAANVSVFGISYASFVYGFGVSFVQGIIVAIIGVTVSFALCGVIAIAGKRGSAPTMVLSRAAFGVYGQKIPGVFSWLISIGWETFLAIMATLATATVFTQLGWWRNNHEDCCVRCDCCDDCFGVGCGVSHDYADAIGADVDYGRCDGCVCCAHYSAY